jgi:hypothetical protein
VHHFLLFAHHGWGYIALGLVGWAVAYWFLTWVITPQSVSELMYHITAVLPILFGLTAFAAFTSGFFGRPQRDAPTILFLVFAVLGLIVAIRQNQQSEIRKALERAGHRPGFGYVIWGLIGAIVFFAIESLLIFGGWESIQGSRLKGLVCLIGGVLLSIAGLLGSTHTRNPLRKGILALKGDYDFLGFWKFLKYMLRWKTWEELLRM